MLVVVASFLLPPNAGEKLLVNSSCLIGNKMEISLSVSNIFVSVCVLYLLHFQNVLPAMSDHIPLIVLFYRCVSRFFFRIVRMCYKMMQNKHSFYFPLKVNLNKDHNCIIL